MAKKTKKPKTKATSEGELPLDDPRWLPLDEALHLMTQHTGSAPLAALDLRQAMMPPRPRVRGMRRFIEDGRDIRRELVPAEVWIEPVLSANLHRFPPDLNLRKIHGWVYYVWKPDIDTLLGKSRTEEKGDGPARRKPGEGYTEDWPLHVAHEVIRILQNQMPSPPKIPSAAVMSKRCENACGYHPDLRAMQKMLKRLLG
jgi:hypothetical protein